MRVLKIETGFRSRNFSSGRPAGPPNVIVIHHWGIDGQRFETVARYLCRKNGNTSAHFVVEAGRVAELVSPENRAWHAGVGGNPRGIGIECRPECRPGDVDQVAELVAYLRRRYGHLPLKKHNDFMSTDCPGRWAAKLGEISARADHINAGGATSHENGARLEVDGVAGPLTVRALQTKMGSPVDGVISSQPVASRVSWPAFTTIEVAAIPTGSKLARALQEFLNENGARLEVDGLLGELTARALQEFLNENGARLEVDGVAGPLTVKALQSWLNR